MNTTTQQAIDTLQSRILALNNNITGETKQRDCLSIAVDQLNNILNTPSSDLLEAKGQVLIKNEEISHMSEDNKKLQSDLQSKLDEANSHIKELQSKLGTNVESIKL